MLSAFAFLAVISALFGALTSIASDLPALENTVQFSHTADSYMYDSTGQPIGPLAPASKPAIDTYNQISPYMRDAIVAVEDRGFWGESGISVRGLIRAAIADLTGGKLQGASTIPEEFIKNVRTEEGHRTIAEKVVEAGMAFQLSHHWTHKHILTEYLNTIYFGNGALGIEAAARVYFGWAHGYNPTDPTHEPRNGCGDPDPANPHRKECASVLTPSQAALLAAIVANPTEFNPVLHPQAALARRNDVVLYDMYQQHYLTRSQYLKARSVKLPTPAEVHLPAQQPSAAPYFTSWVEPQVVAALEREGLSPKAAQYEADYGGLKIKLSLDLNLQREAQQVVDDELFSSPGLPSAALVAIDNRTGEVRAMVSGDNNYDQSPFNLATWGYRQPGSSFKIFTLAAALSEGKINAYSEVDSRPITIHWFYKSPHNAVAAPNGTGRFPVRNFGNVYAGLIPMTVATATSDNSVFAQVGTEVGTGAVANYAELLGIRSPISYNPAMILGGLNHGVSALDMAHAYSTVANGGKKVYNPVLGDGDYGPVGIHSISGCGPCRQSSVTNRGTYTRQVITPTVAATITALLHGPVQDSYGTGTAAAIPGVEVSGKTGTTSNYADAWFVGYTSQMTVAVWVGFPNSGKPMTTLFNGKPVEGGTYPAIIWHNFVSGALQILQNEQQHKSNPASTVTQQLTTNTYTPTTAATTTSTTAASSTVSTQTTPTTVSNQPATLQQTQATNSAGSTSSSSSNQSQTLPQTTAPPPASGGSTGATTTGGTNGGSGL